MSTPRQRSAVSNSVKRYGKAASPAAVPPQTPAPLPAIDDRDGWRTHWQAQGQPWRTEPDIDTARQKELEQHRAVVPHIEKGIYSFKGMKLSRADVEWLLATHNQGQGPIPGEMEISGHARGLDLRGADLRSVDLSRLPLAQLQGGLNSIEWPVATQEQREAAAMHLEGAILHGTDLRHATCRCSHLEGADLRYAHLGGAVFRNTYFAGNATFRPADLRHSSFDHDTSLRNATFSDKIYGTARLADIRWGDTNLGLVDWSHVGILGDEQEAHRSKSVQGWKKGKKHRLNEYQEAVRANRQLAVALRAQGINEEAVRFEYRAQILQKTAFRLQVVHPHMKLKQRVQAWGAWFFSWFLFLLAGYGYKPSRSFLAYFLVISSFATAYYLFGRTVGPTLSPLGAFVFSMTSFHGRGFFPGNNISLDDPLTVLAALEALVGLIIEVTFIATLTQRFFNR